MVAKAIYTSLGGAGTEIRRGVLCFSAKKASRLTLARLADMADSEA